MSCSETGDLATPPPSNSYGKRNLVHYVRETYCHMNQDEPDPSPTPEGCGNMQCIL